MSILSPVPSCCHAPSRVSRVALLSLLAWFAAPVECLAEKGKQTPAQVSATSSKPVKGIGKASWYGPGFHGKKTASGARFNQHQLTAAHRSLPLGTRAVVTNLKTGKQVKVTINDRGPYVKGRSIDLSRAAAQKLGIERDGIALVRIEAQPHPK